jgi:hypothetical protein
LQPKISPLKVKKYCVSTLVIYFLPLLLLSLFPSPVRSFQLTFAWDPNTEADLAGYKIYMGYQTRTYSWQMDAGFQPQATVDNLVEGTPYFFSVTAYNTKGQESGFSNEVRYGSLSVTPQATLAVKKQGAGSGTVSGTGIQCGSDCSEIVIPGSLVTLTAAPAAGSTFGGWSGSCTGSTPTCVLNVNTTTTVTAAFNLSNAYTISATAGSNGTISPSGATPVSPGGSQTYRIAAGSRYRVADVRVDGVSVGALSSYTFTSVKANHSINASFSRRSRSSW